MAVLFAGSELEAFSADSVISFVTSGAGRFDPDYSRGAISAPSGSSVFRAEVGARDELWISVRHFTANSFSSNSNVVAVLDSAGNVLFALRVLAGNVLAAAYYTASTTNTTISPSAAVLSSSPYTLTFHVKMLAANQALVEFFLDGVPISSATVTSAWFSGKKPFSARFNTSGTVSYFSEVIITDSEDPRGWRVATLAPNGSGSSDEWTGSYVDVDEIGVPDDLDFISSATAGQVELFSMSNLSAPAQNMTPVAVCQATRARVGAGGPQNIQPGIRTGGANFFGSSLTGLTPEFGATPSCVWGVNPATSNPWTIAEIQNLEAGYRSAT